MLTTSVPPHLLLLASLASVAIGAPLRGQAAAARMDPRVVRADLARMQGNNGARAWMIIASDFQCPYCKAWHDSTSPKLMKEFVASGKLRVAYVHFPLRNHANALPAAEASMCAGAQDQFWRYHDKLFATFGVWTRQQDPAPTFERIARELKLNLDGFRACLRDDVMLPMIEADKTRAQQRGVKSTPTFLIGNISIPGNAPLDAFRTAINQALAGGMK